MSDNTNETKKELEEAESTEQLRFDEPEAVTEPEAPVTADVPDEPTMQEPVGVPETEVPHTAPPSVKKKIRSKKRITKKSKVKAPVVAVHQKRWPKIAALSAGIITMLALILSGVLSQYFKGKTLPNISVAGISSTAKKPAQLKSQLQTQVKSLKVTLQTDGKTLQPKFEDIGFQIDVDKTVQNALQTKRTHGVIGKLAFWQQRDVPAVISVNDSLLGQYLETNAPELSKPPQDAQLQFNAQTSQFQITQQADGQGANTAKLKSGLLAIATNLKPKTLAVGIATKGPTITQAKLAPLVDPANSLVSRRIVLTGAGFTYKASPADIASWVTPTPKDNGDVKLVIDPAKIQSYVDGIGKKISNAPVDKKVLKDDVTGAETVLQEGQDGTELAGKPALADAIAQALKAGQDATENMNIQTAAYQTVNMNSYDKWIEVDLSEQRTTAYEHSTPVKQFIVATGVRGHETVTGEFAIWLKVRSQTMQGGSKADGDYYDIPNVEWVSYFYQDYALHGAWWRKQFGAPASHGCVNMTNTDAQWVYEWAPIGTKVIVHA